jgi:acetylserotonin N-methyltransferase
MNAPGTLDLTAAPATDPTPLYRSRDEIYADDMLIAALKGFDFFTWIGDRTVALDDVAAHFGCHRRPLDVMTTLFTAMGLLERDGPGLRLSAMAQEYLVASSPWFMGPYFPPVIDRPIARDLLEILRTGQPASYASRRDGPDWHRAMETERFAEEFTAAMDCRGRLLAQALAPRLQLDGHRLLDIAGGSGIYACAFAARHPGLRATVLEKPPVDQIASRAIERRGFGDRVSVMTADMLQGPLPGGYDVHLYSNVLHDWDVDIVRRLIEGSAAALPPGGRIVIHDTFLNREKTGPLPIAAYSVLLMHVTQGRAYSIGEMEDWLEDAGFGEFSEVPSAVGRSALVATKII